MGLRRCLTVLMMAVLIGWLTSHADESKTYDLSGFTGVRASAAVDVELTQGDAFSVSAYTESGDFSGLELQVEDGVLIATRPEEIWKGKNTPSWQRFFGIGSNDKNISIKRANGQRVIKINGERVPTYTVRVIAPSIDRLDASSSSIVTAQEIKTRDLTIKTSTSGDINAEVAGGDVSVDASTSGDVVLSGTCDNLDVKASTSGDVKANNLTCQQGNLQASSGADITAMLTKTVNAHASSGGDILVRGGAKPVKVKESSGGDVSIRN